MGDPSIWGTEQAVTITDTRLPGKATAQAGDRLHPLLTRRAAWLDHDGPLPIIKGTVVRLLVEKLPSGEVNKPVWLWWSGTGTTEADVDRCWQSFLRRFDIKHTFRLFKQTLGWTRPRPRLRSSEAADRWTWLVIAAYAQLRLARPLATDLRRPWEKPVEPNRLTPARVRRGFRNLHARTGSPAGAPKPSRPGPGRPPGSKNRHPAVRTIDRSVESLDLVTACHAFVAASSRVVPGPRDRQLGNDERTIVHGNVARVRATLDWIETAVDTGCKWRALAPGLPALADLLRIHGPLGSPRRCRPDPWPAPQAHPP
nr:DUF6192 family protein [Streptomyces geranii]